MSMQEKKVFKAEKVRTERPAPALVFGLVCLFFAAHFGFAAPKVDGFDAGTVFAGSALLTWALLMVGLFLLIVWAISGTKKQMVAYDPKGKPTSSADA